MPDDNKELAKAASEYAAAYAAVEERETKIAALKKQMATIEEDLSNVRLALGEAAAKLKGGGA